MPEKAFSVCIKDSVFIDPPYNTGAKDWKYNNDYVDGSDAYRHSKWLSFMQRRLRLAKKLLNTKDSVLIVTIDEKEYLHLGCLLEEMFPEANMQMISSVINPKGSMQRKIFPRTDEYIFYVWIGESEPQALPLNNDWLIGNAENTKHNRYRWQPFVRGNILTQKHLLCFIRYLQMQKESCSFSRSLDGLCKTLM